MRADRYVRRKKIVAQARQPGIKATARAFGCSRNTVRRWVRRYRPGHPRPTPGRVTWKPSIDCKKTSSSTARALPVAPSSGSRSPPTGVTSTSPVPTVTNSGRLRSKSSANAIPSWIWPSPRGVHLTLPPNSVNTSPAILPRGVTIYLSIPVPGQHHRHAGLVGSRWNNPNSPGAGHPEKSADARIVEFTQIPPHAERNPQSHPPACVPPTDYSSLVRTCGAGISRT